MQNCLKFLLSKPFILNATIFSSFLTDVILKCLNVTWELHSRFIIKSPVLAKLLEISANLQSQNRRHNTSSTSLKKSTSKNELQQNGQQHDSPLKEERVVSARADQYLISDTRQRISTSFDEFMSSTYCRSSISLTGSTLAESYSEKLTVIHLDITDSMVTKKGQYDFIATVGIYMFY